LEAFASICSGDTISQLPQTSLNGISGSWYPSINNVETTTYTFTPSNNFCATTTTGTMVVNPSATIDTTVASLNLYLGQQMVKHILPLETILLLLVVQKEYCIGQFLNLVY